MRHLRAATLVALHLGGLTAGAAHAAEPTAAVKVTGGEIAGTRAGAMRAFLGVPFAAPPVGALRWRAPQPVVPWQGVKQASSFSAACAQTAVWVSNPKSEDCLYLNIWAPEQAAKLPVIVWIHGGGFYGGTAAQGGFDGGNLAGHGAVVVTVNYRLGIFGFSPTRTCRPNRPTMPPATRACWTRSRRCAGSRATSGPSAAIRSAWRSPASRPAAPRSERWWYRRWRRDCSSAPSPRAAMPPCRSTPPTPPTWTAGAPRRRDSRSRKDWARATWRGCAR